VFTGVLPEGLSVWRKWARDSPRVPKCYPPPLILRRHTQLLQRNGFFFFGFCEILGEFTVRRDVAPVRSTVPHKSTSALDTLSAGSSSSRLHRPGTPLSCFAFYPICRIDVGVTRRTRHVQKYLPARPTERFFFSHLVTPYAARRTVYRELPPIPLTTPRLVL